MTNWPRRNKERARAHKALPFANADDFRQCLLDAFVISDTHFFHERLTSVLAPGSRPDDNHNLMLAYWNETISADTPVLHLGDVVVGITPSEINTLLPPLPGKVFLVDGNHDTVKKLEQFAERGWNLLDPFCAEYKDWLLYFTHEPRDVPPGAINIHGHIHARAERSLQHLNCSVEAQGLRPMLLKNRLDKRIEELSRAGMQPSSATSSLEEKVTRLEALPGWENETSLA